MMYRVEVEIGGEWMTAGTRKPLESAKIAAGNARLWGYRARIVRDQ